MRAQQFRTLVAATAVALSLTALTSIEASAAVESRCDPDVYFELDAYGYVTAYPAARCVGQDTFKEIEIKGIITVQGAGQDFQLESASYQNKPAGVWVGKARSIRNPEGTNAFCASVIVYWTFPRDQIARSSSGRSCANY